MTKDERTGAIVAIITFLIVLALYFFAPLGEVQLNWHVTGGTAN